MESLCSALHTLSKILSTQPFLLTLLMLMIPARTTDDSSPVFAWRLLRHIGLSAKLNCRKLPMKYSCEPQTLLSIHLMAELTTTVYCLFFLPSIHRITECSGLEGISVSRTLECFVEISVVIFGKADLFTVQLDGL